MVLYQFSPPIGFVGVVIQNEISMTPIYLKKSHSNDQTSMVLYQVSPPIRRVGMVLQDRISFIVFINSANSNDISLFSNNCAGEGTE